MTQQHHEIIDTLIKWSQLNTREDSQNSHELKLSNDVSKIYQITTAKRGKAQKLPASTLLPV
ncbi:MAG TPA: hypothetical protein ENI26_08095 [Methylophaga aminisulfidivorans]|nr:hypothetical protein [Methylophaga sp.]HEC74318.1 hypothetical protein [Methylophaga aminisulfidivorans]